jgi:hypothetical protein
VTTVAATSLTDPVWLRSQIGLAARRYGCAPVAVLGTIWWYSASSVLVAPALESLAETGRGTDPALDAVTLDIAADGRLLGGRAERPFTGGPAALGQAMGEALEAAIATIETVTGARRPALRAIATDSVANRLLWAGSPELAEPLLAATALPRPRFTEVGPNLVVRRASCCLIYQAGQPKCVSCPRQPPVERTRRLETALGLA